MLGSLTTEHYKTMWGVVEDSFRYPALTAWREALPTSRADTMNVAVSLQGTLSSELNSAWSREERFGCIFAVRGTTGFVLGALLARIGANAFAISAWIGRPRSFTRRQLLHSFKFRKFPRTRYTSS